MPSTFFGLHISSSGLRASNASLNTTANNISNADTDGYSRQQTVQQAYEALRTFTTYGCAGAGVDTIAIERIRDEFYDTKYWNNQCLVGEYEVKQEYYSQIEAYFTDDSTTDGFRKIFDNLLLGLGEVEKTPDQTTTKAQLVGYASSLTEYFNNLCGNLEDLQKSINSEIKVKVDEINSIASQIATLNKQINVVEISTGGTANELRDQRALLVDQLSEVVDVSVTEIDVVDTNNPDRETGATQFIVKIGGNQLLVNGSDYNSLECTARASYERVHLSDVDGLYDIKWSDGQAFSLGTNSKGALKGLLELRDGNNGESFNGEIVAVAGNSVKVEVTAEYLTELNKTNLSEQGTAVLGNQLFYYDGWTYSQEYNEITGETSYYFTFNIDEGRSDTGVSSTLIGKEATTGKAVEYQGIPYYMAQMNEWIRTFSQGVNDILCSGYGSKGAEGCNLFTGDEPATDDQFDLPNGENGTVDNRYYAWTNGGSISCYDDSYYRITAKNFNVLSAVEDDADLLATKKDYADGAAAYDIIEELTYTLKSKDKMSFRNCSAGDFLTCILSDVSLNANAANTFYENYTNISTTINNQRISISGVDTDEEAMNLVQFQNSYNLASRMIQTMSEIYDRLILQTGV